jgi:collagen type I alpha
MTSSSGITVDPVDSVTDAQPHLVINVSYDSSVTSLQTTNLTLYNEYTTAVQTAVQFYENAISSPITVNINFGWGEVANSPIDPGASGESSTSFLSETYAQLYGAVKTTDVTSPVQVAAVNSLPTTDPTGGATFLVATAEAKALGLTPASTDNDGSVGLDSSASENWAWTQATVGPTNNDAVGTLEHEISEVMGRSATGGNGGQYELLDLFRYTAANGGQDDAPGSATGARDEPFAAGYSTTAPASATPGLNSFSYFSFNGTTVTLPYETPADVASGSDVADWDPNTNSDSYADGPTGQVDLVSATDLNEMNILGYDLTCFVEGTRILTAEGEKRIETLTPGDEVPTLLGGSAKVIWLGRRAMDLTRHPNPRLAWPIRVRAGAFAPGLPARDLFLSPNHAIYVDGVLIPVKLLTNGSSIQQVERDHVVYHHVELERHDVILAETLPVESYLDAGDRENFSGGAVTALHPDFSARTWEMAGCAPMVLTGTVLDAVRTRLTARATPVAALISAGNGRA